MSLPTNKTIFHRIMDTQKPTITIRANLTALGITLLSPRMVELTAAVTLVAATAETFRTKVLTGGSRGLGHIRTRTDPLNVAGEHISATCNGRPRGLEAVVGSIARAPITEIGHKLRTDRNPTMTQSLP